MCNCINCPSIVCMPLIHWTAAGFIFEPKIIIYTNEILFSYSLWNHHWNQMWTFAVWFVHWMYCGIAEWWTWEQSFDSLVSLHLQNKSQTKQNKNNTEFNEPLFAMDFLSWTNRVYVCIFFHFWFFKSPRKTDYSTRFAYFPCVQVPT